MIAFKLYFYQCTTYVSPGQSANCVGAVPHDQLDFSGATGH